VVGDFVCGDVVSFWSCGGWRLGQGFRTTHGRKLQAEFGRLETRVKISDIRRCCTLVSCRESKSGLFGSVVCGVGWDGRVVCRTL